MKPKTEADFDAVSLGAAFGQSTLDRLYEEFVVTGKSSVAACDGAPVFVVKVSYRQYRRLVKQRRGTRSDFRWLPGSEYLRHIGIDRAFCGWMHWVVVDRVAQEQQLEEWLKTSRKKNKAAIQNLPENTKK